MIKRAAALATVAVLGFVVGYVVRDTSARDEAQEHLVFVESVKELSEIKGAPFRMYDRINQIVRESKGQLSTTPREEKTGSLKTRRPPAN